MKYALDFLPEVYQDVQEAYDWYEKQSIGLGEDLLLSIDDVIDSIHRKPLLNKEVYKSIRKAKTKRFPFGIFFNVGKDTITILAITHLSRHPRTWQTRTKLKKK